MMANARITRLNPHKAVQVPPSADIKSNAQNKQHGSLASGEFTHLLSAISSSSFMDNQALTMMHGVIVILDTCDGFVEIVLTYSIHTSVLGRGLSVVDETLPNTYPVTLCRAETSRCSCIIKLLC